MGGHLIVVGARESYTLERGTLRPGGQAEVYRARAASGRSVAVKLAKEPGEAGAWMDMEVRTLARLSENQGPEPWIVPLLDHGVSEDGRRFLVLDWYDASLAGWLKRNPPIERRLDAMERAISATIRLHRSPTDLEAVLLHRDLKPGNLLVREEGDRLEVVLADLGGVKEGRLLAHTQNTGLSTRWYAPLEQQLPLVGALDASVDVHGLAVTLYETLVGRVPQASLTREGALTAEGRRLIALVCQGDARTPDEEADHQELRRAPLSRLVAFEQAPPLTNNDRVRLREATADLLRGRVSDPEELATRLSELLVPVLEHALQADPARRLTNPQHLLAACRQARRLLGEALPAPVVAVEEVATTTPPPVTRPGRVGLGWLWLALGVLPLTGLAAGAGLWWLHGAGPADAPREAQPELPAAQPAIVNVVAKKEEIPAVSVTPARSAAPKADTTRAARPASPASTTDEDPQPGGASAVVETPPGPAATTAQKLAIKVNHRSHLSPRVRLSAGGETLQDTTGPSTVKLEAGTSYVLEVSTDGAPACSATLLATQGDDASWTLRIAGVEQAAGADPMLRCADNGRYILKN